MPALKYDLRPPALRGKNNLVSLRLVASKMSNWKIQIQLTTNHVRCYMKEATTSIFWCHRPFAAETNHTISCHWRVAIWSHCTVMSDTFTASALTYIHSKGATYTPCRTTCAPPCWWHCSFAIAARQGPGRSCDQIRAHRIKYSSDGIHSRQMRRLVDCPLKARRDAFAKIAYMTQWTLRDSILMALFLLYSSIWTTDNQTNKWQV